MATRTVSNAGGNWNATATWVGGVVPVANDDIAFTATSGNLTVNVATANLIGVNFTNYVGTITFNNVINTSGVLNLGTGGYTQAGASGIIVNGTTTLTSGGVTWSRTLTFTGTSITYTFVGNWTSTGNITLSGTTASTFTGNTLNIGANLTQTTTATISGTTAFVFNGTGTWSNSSTGVLRNNTTVNTAGTLTMSGNLYYNTGTFTYTAGTVTTTGSTLNVAAATTFNTGTFAWNNFTTTGTTYTITRSSNLNITGTLTLNHTGTLSFSGAFTFNPTGDLIVTQGTTTIPNTLNVTNFTINGSPILNTNTINISGNLTTTATGICSGTTSLVLTGTGTWNNTSTGTIRNNLNINAGANTITVSGNVRYDTGTLTYTSGTVSTTGSLLIIGANTTLNTNGIIWNDISGQGTTQITLGSNLTLTGTLDVRNTGSSLSFILGGNTLVSANANLSLGTACTFTLPANQTFKSLLVSATSGTLNSNSLTITENLTINTSLGGTTNIIYGGTGTWTASSNSIISNNFTINTAGTLTISGNVYKGGGTFTYTAGTVIDTGATIYIGATANTTLNVSGKTWEKLLVNVQTTLTSNLNATTFGTHNIGGGPNTTFVLGAFSLNFTHLELGGGSTTILPTAWVCQDLTLVVGTGGALSGFSITINRNFIQAGVGGTYSGSTTIIYAVPALSTGTWSRTGLSYFLNSFTINSAGTINFTGGIIGGGIFTYTAGTFNCQVGSTLYNRATGTTFNGVGITWYNVVFGTVTGITSVASVTLNTQLICIGTLTIQNSSTTFAGTNGTFDTYGFVLGTDATALRTTTLLSTKTYRVRQSFTSTQPTNAFRVLLRSTTGGSQAIFTVDNGATINVGFVNATDIDSSLGRTIYSYNGVFSNTLNWSLLPVDVTPTESSFTFIS